MSAFSQLWFGGYYAAASASEEFENAVLQRPAWRIVG